MKNKGSAKTLIRSFTECVGDVTRLFFTRLCLITLFFEAIPSIGHSNEFSNALSLQGYTGLLNTPNAEVTADGKFSMLYSNQIEQQWRSMTPREDNYIFSVGVLPFVELGGRLTDKTGPGSDLSANVKIKLPLFPAGTHLPTIAVGMQDVGGGAKLLQTKYLVATEEFWRLRFSLGAGTGPDRLKGMFGGAEFRAFDWLYLIGENDTKDTNIGGRLVSSVLFGRPLTLQFTAKTSLDSQSRNTALSFGLQFPLGNEHYGRSALPPRTEEVKQANPELASGPSFSGQGITLGLSDFPGAKAQQGGTPAPSSLLEKLTAEGFRNVKVGTRGGELLVVEYENNRYNHNELDGLGVVLGTVIDAVPTGFEMLRIVMKKQDLRVLQLSAPLDTFKAFLHDPGAYPLLNEKLRITTDTGDGEGVSFISGPANPSWLDSSLVLYPGLKTFVGTEVGTADYLLSAKLDYFLNIWKGAVLNARADLPVAWSDNFNDNKAYRSDRQDSQFDRLMLFQAVRISPEIMANIGGGMVVHDGYGTLNEVMWTPGEGIHRFSIKQAYVSTADSQVQRQKNEVYLGSYRYYYSPLDLYLEGTGGKFFDNDKGIRFEIKRFFGDTAFSVYYSNSTTISREHVQVGGIMIALPLTPRRDMKPGLLQLRGSDEWSYAEKTEIVKSGQANTVTTSVGVDPVLPYNLARIFYNRDRLSEEYIRKYFLRVRNACLTFFHSEVASLSTNE